MTDKYGVPELPGDEPDQTPESHDQSPVEHDEQSILEGAGDFTSGEGLVAFAGMVLAAVWIIFDFIADGYDLNNTVFVLAVAVIVIPRLNRATVEKVHPVPVLMKVLGWALVAFGIMELAIDLRFNAYDDFGRVIGALAAYAGFTMAFVGARQIKI